MDTARLNHVRAKVMAAHKKSKGIREDAPDGHYPSEDIEPTQEQLSAVDQLVRSGSLPYVDFSLFGPRGKRAERKLSHVALSFNMAPGTWIRQEQPGPPNVEAWV
eukprot:14023334-Alexandrium_andersonii.AAC.1